MISPTGYWTMSGTDLQKEHYFDPQLAQSLLVWMNEHQIVNGYDLGCGLGE